MVIRRFKVRFNRTIGNDLLNETDDTRLPIVKKLYSVKTEVKLNA